MEEHTEFLWRAMQEYCKRTTGKEQNQNTIQAHFIESCRKREKKDFNLVNKKEMCPYCYNPWSNGYYKIKSHAKMKKKGKYNVTALELVCLQCHNKVQINNSKVKRSEICAKLEKSHITQEKEKSNEIKTKDKLNIKSINGTVLTIEKKKKNNDKSLINVKNEPKTMEQMLSKTPNLLKKSVPSLPIKSSIQVKNNNTKRLKFQKHLKKTNQTPTMPKSSLENFLSSVHNF